MYYNENGVTAVNQMSKVSNSQLISTLKLFIDCSGLAIVSRFPFKEVEFNSFTDHGDAAKMFIDGEWYARKGAGRVQIEPLPNVTVSGRFRNQFPK